MADIRAIVEKYLAPNGYKKIRVKPFGESFVVSDMQFLHKIIIENLIKELMEAT